MLESTVPAGPMHLVLVVPELLAQPRDALAGVPALARLAARSRAAPAPDLDSALLAALGLDIAIAPLAALGAGVAADARWRIRADPVTMTVTHEDVRIDARVDDLDDDEVRALRVLMTGHFAADGLAFEAPRRDAWFVASASPFDVSTTPLDAAIGRPLRDRLPQGADAARWRRWLTEAQMLLHEHPLAQRAGAGVHGLWFSHGGSLPEAEAVAGIGVHAVGAAACDVATGIAALAGAPVAQFTALESAIERMRKAIVVVAPAASASGLDAIASTLLTPALQALNASRIARMTLVADGHHAAAAWTAQPIGWLERLRRRSAAFELPVVEPR